MKKRKIAALVLALALLTACGGEQGGKGEPAQKDDLSYQTTGLTRDQAVVLVNGDRSPRRSTCSGFPTR